MKNKRGQNGYEELKTGTIRVSSKYNQLHYWQKLVYKAHLQVNWTKKAKYDNMDFVLIDNILIIVNKVIYTIA